MTKTLRRAAIAGAGDIARVHLAALAGLGIEVAAMIDPDLDRARACAEPIEAAYYPSLAEALEREKVDVVHVCTPHDQHLPVALDALAHGTHVVLEKPLAHTLAAAERVAAAAESGAAKVAVCFQNRYNPTSRAMKDALEGGALGAVVAAAAAVPWHRDAAYYERKPWAGQRERSGGGALINQAIHTIDLMQWLLGPVVTVSGQTSQLLPSPGVDVEDTAVLTLTHGPANVRSTMWATNTHGVDAPVSIDITGETGSLRLGAELTLTTADGVRTVTDEAADATVPSYWGQSHSALIADFYTRLDEPEPFWISPREALKSQRILNEVYRQSGLTPQR